MVGECKHLEGFNKDTIIEDLKKENYEDVKSLRIIAKYMFTQCIIDITEELEKDFSEQGNRHYPRQLLLGILLYCFSLGMYKYSQIAKECRQNRYLRIFYKRCGTLRKHIQKLLK